MKLLFPLAWLTLAPLAPAQTPSPVPSASPSATPAAFPLDGALAADTLWTMAPDPFLQQTEPLGFHWISAAHDSAQTTRRGATLFGLPVCQAIARFDGSKPVEITVLFYNRGDSGEIARAAYDALVHKAAEGITAATHVQFTPRGRDASNAVKADGILWNTAVATYLLEYSSSKEVQTAGVPFRAEFVRLTIKPRQKPKDLLTEARDAAQGSAPFVGLDHVANDAASGDIAIKDIPMVDQGAKGYCVVASAERVLRYYGIHTDENELAQLANSSATAGTSMTAMTESLKKLTARLKIRVRTLDEITATSMGATIADYNRAAKQFKAPEINPGFSTTVQDVYSQMKPDVLRLARTKNHGGVTVFERKVKSHIDKGVPVLWSVMLGVIPEEHLALKKPEGHMRLIIGYNEKTGEIIYSDSWGLGHESKRMPTGDAWAITCGMATIEPF